MMKVEIGDKIRVTLGDLEDALAYYIQTNGKGYNVEGEVVDIVPGEERDEYYVNVKLPNVCLYESEFALPYKKARRKRTQYGS